MVMHLKMGFKIHSYKLISLKEEINKTVITVGDSNVSLSRIDRTSIADLSNTTN